MIVKSYLTSASKGKPDVKKTQYISQTVYKGTRTRSGTTAKLYRTQALASLMQKVKVGVDY